jgi:hypothetical protein
MSDHQPGATEMARLQHLDVPVGRGIDRLLRGEEPRDRADQTRPRLRIDVLGARRSSGSPSPPGCPSPAAHSVRGYLLPIKRAVRNAEDLDGADVATVTVELIEL